MTAVFLKILNMSLTAVIIAAAVMILRLLLRRAPRALVCALWLLVGLRLLVPFTFESPLSLMPANDTVTESSDGSISVNTGIGFINSALSTPQTPPQSIILPEGFTPPADIPDSGEPSNGTVTIPDAEEGNESEHSVSAVDIAAIVWASGTVLMVIYAAVSYLRIRSRVRESVKVEKSIFICDRIDSPFILGVIRPRIYMPSDTPEGDTPYIISHEKAHLKRLDHLWKPLGFFLLSLHWFNPVMWLCYVLLCRDIELACDEKVIRAMGEDAKKPYSDALISASVPRRLISACPLAFGEIGVKKRIKAVLSYKKPTLWIIIAAVLALTVAAVCLLTDRKDAEEEAPFCIEAQNSFSDMEGVWAEITKTDTVNGKLTVVWHNDTDKELTFGEEFHIYRVEENGNTVDTYTLSEEYVWNLLGYPVAPGGTFEKEYNVSEHEILKNTPHRYETYFHIAGDNPVPDGLKKYAVSIDFATSESFIPESKRPAESDTPDLPTPDVLSNLEKVEASDDVKCTITLSGYTEQVTVEGDVAKALYGEVATSITDNEKHFNVPSEQPSVGLSFTVNGFENKYYFRVFDNDTVQTELPIHTTICRGYALKSGTYENVKAIAGEHFTDMPEIHMNLHTFPSVNKVTELDNFACILHLDGYNRAIIKGDEAKEIYQVLAEASKDMTIINGINMSAEAISFCFAASDNITVEEPYPDDAHYYGSFSVDKNDIADYAASPALSFRMTYNFPEGTYEKVKALVEKHFIGIPSEYHVGRWTASHHQSYETLTVNSVSSTAVSFTAKVTKTFTLEATAHEKDGKYYFGEDVSTRFEAPDGVSGYLEFTPDGIIMTIDSLGVMEGQAPFNNVYHYTIKLTEAMANGISNSYDIIFEFTDYIVDTEKNGFNDDEGPTKGLLGLHEMLQDEYANAVRNALFAYLYDLNGDGSNELIIAVNNLSDGTSPYFDGRVLAIYTADENGKGKLILEGYSRNKAYHLENGDILIFASGGATHDSIGTYNLSADGTSLECKEMYFREFDEVWYNTSGELDKENSKKLDMDADAYAKLGEDMKNNLISVPFDSKYYSFSVDYFEPTDTYVCHDTKEAIPPSINLYSGAYFTFTYSYLSSYAPHGTYELTDETLTLRTSDGLYTYVFNVTPGDSLRFDSTRSSPLPKYKYSADAAEASPPFGDGAKFTKVLDNTNYIPTSISIGEALSTVYPDTAFDKESVVKIFLNSDEYDGEYANVEDSETISKIIGTIKSAPLVKYETIDPAPGAGAQITFYGDGSTVIFRAYVNENKVVFNHSNVFTTNDGYFAELCELIESLQYDPEKTEPASLEDVVSETTALLKDYGWTDITVVDGEVDTLALVGSVITPEYKLASNERLTSITAKGSYTIASKTCKYYVIIRIAENSETGSAMLVETIYPYRNMQGSTLAEFVKNYNKRGEILRADDSDLAFALTSDTHGYDAYEYYFDIDPYNEAYACTKFNEKYIPMVYLNTENGTFSFPYSKRSFYLPKGHYERTNTSLTLRTGDGLYIYVFKIAADGTLKFDATSSSAFPEYKSSEKHGNVLTPFDDGTVFTKALDGGSGR